MKKTFLTLLAITLGLTFAFNGLMAKPADSPAKQKGLQSLDYTPVYYHTDKVKGTEVVDDDWWSGYDKDKNNYDTSTIKKSPNGQTLHDVLEFFGSDVLKRDYFKPFVMTKVEKDKKDKKDKKMGLNKQFDSPSPKTESLDNNEEGSLYKSRGELINYEFKEEFGGDKRRAVISTWLKLDGDEQFKWMIKRVDYYTRGEEKPEYLHSLVYTVWNDDLGANWNLEDDWTVNAHGNLHDMTITEQTGDSFEGRGDYQDGPQTWTIENGEVDGDNIEMDWIYQNSNYEAYFEGTVEEDGSISGTFDDIRGNKNLSWNTKEGEAAWPSVPGNIYDSTESAIEAGAANLGGQR